MFRVTDPNRMSLDEAKARIDECNNNIEKSINAVLVICEKSSFFDADHDGLNSVINTHYNRIGEEACYSRELSNRVDALAHGITTTEYVFSVSASRETLSRPMQRVGLFPPRDSWTPESQTVTEEYPYLLRTERDVTMSVDNEVLYATEWKTPEVVQEYKEGFNAEKHVIDAIMKDLESDGPLSRYIKTHCKGEPGVPGNDA